MTGRVRYKRELTRATKTAMPLIGRIDLVRELVLDMGRLLPLPNFATCNILLAHTLDVKVIFSCAQKTFRICWKRIPLFTFPSRYEEHRACQVLLRGSNLHVTTH